MCPKGHPGANSAVHGLLAKYDVLRQQFRVFQSPGSVRSVTPDMAQRWAILNRFCLALLLLAHVSSALAQSRPEVQSTNSPALITNAAQILGHSFDSGPDRLPAKIRGIVTYADPDWGVWYVQDQTSGVYVYRGRKATQRLAPGMEVEIEGVARQGGFAPMIEEMGLKILGTNTLPPAMHANFDQTQGGQLDSQWIELEGIIHYIRPDDGHLHIRFSAPQDMHVYLPGYTNEPTREILQFADARVRIRGVCSTKYTPQGNLLTPTLLVPDVQSIQIIEPAIADPFSLPLQALATPLKYANARRFGHRIKVAGTLTSRVSPMVFFMQDHSGGAFVHTREPTTLALGDRIEVAAFPEPGGATPSLMDALAKLISHGPLPAPEVIDASQPLKVEWDCKLASIEGECVDEVRGKNSLTLIMRAGEGVFEGICAFPEIDQVLGGNMRGARIVFTGVVAVELDDVNAPEHMHITARRLDDVRIIRPPPWWTASRALGLFGTATMLLAAWGIQGLWRQARLKEKYRLIFDNATDLVSTHTIDGHFTSANRSWEIATGHPLATLRTMHFEEVLATDQVSGWKHWWKIVCTGSTAPTLEIKITGTGGKCAWLEISGLLIKDDRGNPQVECIGRDVTRRRRSDELRTGQRKTLELIANGAALPEILNGLLRFAEEQSPGMFGSILLLDSDGVTLRHGAAPSLEAEFTRTIDGFAAGEGVGSCGTAVARGTPVIVSDIMTDPLWKPYWPLATKFGLRACWSTPIFSRSQRILGTFAFYYKEPRSPSGDDLELIEAASSLASIAIERKLAEEALRQITMLQRAVLDSAGVSIISADVDGRILSFNRAAERLLGWRATEVVGKFNIAQFHDAEELQAQADALTRELGRPITADSEVFAATARAAKVDEREWTYITKTGGRIPVLVSTTTLADGSGRFAGYLCVGADLTSRKKDEQARALLETQLRQSQKMQAIGTLAGGIAHDFNNILSAILGNAELLKMDLPPAPAFQDSLASILKASERARILVRHILAFSRSEEPDRHPMVLLPVITEALELIRASVPSTVEINAALEATQLRVLANATQIHQVLMNLCSNANQALHGAPGRIDLATRVVDIDQSTAQSNPELHEGKYIILSVSDNGCGMDKQTLERIFEPFFTTKAPGEGTGLGLAVVHGIMQSHGGAITVTSAPGKGTSFQLYFPAIEMVQPAAPEASLPLPKGNGERVLIVDDEPAIATLAAKLLTRLNYAPTALTSPAAAVTAFEAAPSSFDLVITDFTMPQMTGIDLARRLLEIRPGLPIILCTGHRSMEQEAEFMKLGIRLILNKPFHTDTLAQAIREALSPKRS